MHDCDAEFRFFWAHTRLTQECDACEPPDPSVGREYAFAPTPWYECATRTGRGGRTRRETSAIAKRTGCCFITKTAAYDVGATPLVLLWRDAKTSTFFGRDEGAPSVLARAGVEPRGRPRAHVVALAKSADGNFFVTGDDEPAIIAAVAAVPFARRKRWNPPTDSSPVDRDGFSSVPAVSTSTPKPPSCAPPTCVTSDRNRQPLTGFDERPRAILHRCRSSIAPICCQRFFNARSRVAPLAVERLLLSPPTTRWTTISVTL